MKNSTYVYIIGLLLAAALNAAPIQVFLGPDLALPKQPPSFWGGETARLHVYSNKEIFEHETYLITTEMSLKCNLDKEVDLPYMTKGGLFLHELSFIAPETKVSRQRYLILYDEGLLLYFDVFPQWLREQVKRKAAAYSIEINEPSSNVQDFFNPFLIDAPKQDKRPVLEIIHSEHEILLQRSGNKVAWKTNFTQLDANDPIQTLRFEKILDTLAELNQK